MSRKPQFLMVDPANYGVDYEINPWMRPGVWGADPAANARAARSAWLALKRALEAAGGEVHVADGATGQPDMVFPANAAVVLDGKAVLARFRHPERQGEEPHFLDAFLTLRAQGAVNTVEPITGCFQEGAGDCIWDASRRLFWVGSGPRSSAASARILGERFGDETVSLPLATEQFYHLDTCFCPLSGGEILYFPPALTERAKANLTARVDPDDLIESGAEDAAGFCVNAVSLGRTLIMARPPRRLKDRLTERGYAVVGIDLDPFILSGGGAFCMTLRLDLTSSAAALARREPALAAI